jgi:hypothetical protein
MPGAHVKEHLPKKKTMIRVEEPNIYYIKARERSGGKNRLRTSLPFSTSGFRVEKRQSFTHKTAMQQKPLCDRNKYVPKPSRIRRKSGKKHSCLPSSTAEMGKGGKESSDRPSMASSTFKNED